MQEVVEKESHEAVQTIYAEEKHSRDLLRI